MNYILDGKLAKQEPDIIAWARWFESAQRHVAFTKINDDIEVSTVFLGLDHSFGAGLPVLFETMIFGGERDQELWRWHTWEEAETGHEDIVRMLQHEAP